MKRVFAGSACTSQHPCNRVDGIVITRMIGPGEVCLCPSADHSRSPALIPLISRFSANGTIVHHRPDGFNGQGSNPQPRIGGAATKAEGYRPIDRVSTQSESHTFAVFGLKLGQSSRAALVGGVFDCKIEIGGNKQSKRPPDFPIWSVCPPSLEPTLFLGRAPSARWGSFFRRICADRCVIQLIKILSTKKNSNRRATGMRISERIYNAYGNPPVSAGRALSEPTKDFEKIFTLRPFFSLIIICGWPIVFALLVFPDQIARLCWGGSAAVNPLMRQKTARSGSRGQGRGHGRWFLTGRWRPRGILTLVFAHRLQFICPVSPSVVYPKF